MTKINAEWQFWQKSFAAALRSVCVCVDHTLNILSGYDPGGLTTWTLQFTEIFQKWSCTHKQSISGCFSLLPHSLGMRLMQWTLVVPKFHSCSFQEVSLITGIEWLLWSLFCSSDWLYNDILCVFTHKSSSSLYWFTFRHPPWSLRGQRSHAHLNQCVSHIANSFTCNRSERVEQHKRRISLIPRL